MYLLKVEKLGIDRGFVGEVLGRLRGLGLEGFECDEVIDVLVDSQGLVALHIALYKPDVPNLHSLLSGAPPAIVLP